MNAQINTFLTALAAVAASVVLALALAESADPVSPDAGQAIVKLERVVTVGKAVPTAADGTVTQRIETLPRVVITGRHADAPDAATRMAMACTVQAGC